MRLLGGQRATEGFAFAEDFYDRGHGFHLEGKSNTGFGESVRSDRGVVKNNINRTGCEV